MSNEQQPPDEPADRESESTESEETDQELQRRIQEKRKKLRELERELDQELEESEELLRKRRRTEEGEEDVGSRFGVRIERTAEDLESTIESYVSSILDSVANSMEGALNGLFSRGDRAEAKKRRKQRKKGEKLRRKMSKETYHLTDEELKAFPEESAQILDILADANRLKILQELETGPDYQKDLSERTGIKGGQWKHHTDILKEARFVDQEAVRGRYLITQLGLEALKLAEMLYIRKKAFEHEMGSDFDEELGDQGDFEVPIE